MSEIIPRWEWRSFGPHFGDAEARLKARGADKVEHSDEIYLLSSVSDANVKIRDGLMDIKHLEKTNTHGFEQWRPVLKAAFPLPVAAIQAVFAALGVASPPELNAVSSSFAKPSPAGEGCVLMSIALPQEFLPIKLDQLLAEVTANSKLRALQVHKARTRYHLEDCMAELTGIVADGKTIRTIAVESEDPDRIAAALRALDLERIENVSYPLGLKRLVKMAS